MPDYPQIITERRRVPNQFPSFEPKGPARIAIIGEAPGEKEEDHGLPFIGPSGRLLNSILENYGINRDECFIGNVCQYRPPQNKIARFAWSGTEIQSGLTHLRADLTRFDPTMCLLLGNTAVRAARGIDSKVTDWSGSLFYGAGNGFERRKCIAGFHPAAILRMWGKDGNFPRLNETVKRLVEEAPTRNLILPQRRALIDLSCNEYISILDNWPAGVLCSVDIEGGIAVPDANDGVKANSKKRKHLGLRCMAFTARTDRAICIAFWKFTPEEQGRLMRAIARLMFRIDVPKVLQNSLYDQFVLIFSYGILIRNVVHDTMVKGWEIYSELPKSLSCQASIYTREPHWKDEEMYESDGDGLAIGCCKDVSVTLEICNQQDAELQPNPLGRRHYEINMQMLKPALYMELRGIKYNQASVDSKIRDIRDTGWTDKRGKHYPPILAIGDRLCAIAGKEIRGEKGAISSVRLAKIMYEQMGYPPQYKKDDEGNNKYTTDIGALLTIRKRMTVGVHVTKSTNDQLEFLDGIISHRYLEGLLETLNVKADADGRVRCAYNIVGTETGRFSCKTSPTGAGANLTTITKDLRGNYIADDDYDFCQCDLAGADGWTVAAHCSKLGDDTMLLDYRHGLKPAKITAGIYCFGAEFNKLDRDSLLFWGDKKQFAQINKAVGSGIYDCCKVVQHGSNYLMGIPTMQTNVMLKSHKESGTPIYMELRDGAALQAGYFSRYRGVQDWHTWADAVLSSKGELTSATGHTRIFFGRRFGDRSAVQKTLGGFLADEPQQNTTWATNLAMLRLWKDPANRIAWVDRTSFRLGTVDGTVWYWQGTMSSFSRMVPGGLLVEPLHQVHDALCVQWPKFLRQWASKKMREWFDNSLTIAGIPITIPFEGTYGPSWGSMPNSL